MLGKDYKLKTLKTTLAIKTREKQKLEEDIKEIKQQIKKLGQISNNQTELF